MAAEACPPTTAPAPRTRLPDLHAAQDALAVAYDQARLSGYRPGSAEMVDLVRAEARYQLAKRRSTADFSSRAGAGQPCPTLAPG